MSSNNTRASTGTAESRPKYDTSTDEGYRQWLIDCVGVRLPPLESAPIDVSGIPKPPTELADEAEMRRTGRTLAEIYARCGSTPVRVAEEKRATPRRALTDEQKATARGALFALVCKLYDEPVTIAEVIKRAAIALGISEDEPTLPELTDAERRYCIDEAVLHVASDPNGPSPSLDDCALFDLAVDIHYERLCIALRWSKAEPDQRGPVIRRSLMRRMGL